MDVDQIQPGSDFTTAILEAVDDADVFVVLIGSQWLTITAKDGGRRIDQPDDWVALEIATALRRGTRVIPVLVDDAEMPRRNELPLTLADLANRPAMRIAHKTFAADSARLIQTIEGIESNVLLKERSTGSATQPQTGGVAHPKFKKWHARPRRRKTLGLPLLPGHDAAYGDEAWTMFARALGEPGEGLIYIGGDPTCQQIEAVERALDKLADDRNAAITWKDGEAGSWFRRFFTSLGRRFGEHDLDTAKRAGEVHLLDRFEVACTGPLSSAVIIGGGISRGIS